MNTLLMWSFVLVDATLRALLGEALVSPANASPGLSLSDAASHLLMYRTYYPLCWILKDH